MYGMYYEYTFKKNVYWFMLEESEIEKYTRRTVSV